MTPEGKIPGYLHLAAVEELEESQGMLVFLFSCLIEDASNLDEILLPGPRGEKIITGTGLGLSGKRDKQVMRCSALAKTHRYYFDDDRLGPAFSGSTENDVLEMIGDLIHLDDGEELVLIILEHFRAKLIAVSVSHALLGNCHFHASPFFMVNNGGYIVNNDNSFSLIGLGEISQIKSSGFFENSYLIVTFLFTGHGDRFSMWVCRCGTGTQMTG